MKLLMIGGNIPSTQLNEIMKNSKGLFQFSSNEFQNKLIMGFKEILKDDFYILSAPFINSYPNGYKKIYYRGLKCSANEKYVSFFNMWGIRNISRTFHLNKGLNSFLNEKDSEKYIIVYSPHVPFLKAAIKAKKRNKNIKIILLLPDLPQFVALSDNQSLIYRLLKPYDTKQFYKLSQGFDSYILLTEQMNDFVNAKRDKKFMVVEGIANNDYLETLSIKHANRDEFKIVYTGTLHKKFGVKDLVDAFKLTTNQNYKLLLCGCGDSEEYIIKSAQEDKRIEYLGQIDNVSAVNLQRDANLLINPRKNTDEFTKYSFPSKNMEYLSSGNPVITYKLDGMPDEYDKILFYPNGNELIDLKNKIDEIYDMNDEQLNSYVKTVKKFMKSKSFVEVCKRILRFIEE